MTTTTQSNTDVVLATVDALNRHDSAAMMAAWIPDGVERFPDATCNGTTAIGAYFQAVFDAFPDARLTPEATAEQGDAVFLRWTLSGTHTGAPFAGIAPTGKTVTMAGMDHFTIRDGKIVSNFVVFDQMDMGRQLGLLPPDGSPPDKALKAAFNGVTALREAITSRR